MKQLIFNTTNSWAPFVLRVLLAIVLIPHGAQKLFGAFAGYGFTGTMSFFTDTVGLPWMIGFIVIMLEFFGPIALAAGFLTRPVSMAITILMAGIVFTSHIQYGFWMNWFNNQQGEGYEYFIIYLAGTLSLLISGGGKWSVDRLFINK